MRAKKIRELLQTAYNNVIHAGFELLDAKESIEKGYWIEWITTEVNISLKTAERCMASARIIKNILGDSWQEHSLFGDTTALYQLASPGVPQQAKEQAVGMMVQGHYLTRPLIDSIVSGVERATKTMALIPHVSPSVSALIEEHNLEPGVVAALTIMEKEMPEQFQEICSSGVVYYDGDPISLSDAGERDVMDFVKEVRFETRMSKNGIKPDNVISGNVRTNEMTVTSLDAPHVIATTSGARLITVVFEKDSDLNEVVRSIHKHGGHPVSLVVSFD